MMPRGMGSLRTSLLTLSLIWSLGGMLAAAPPVAPPRPKEYRVHLRYRIRAARNERIAQFLELTRHLEAVGFHKDSGPENEVEDAEQTHMTGTIASERALQILSDRHVKAILLIPADYALPVQAEQRVKVQLGLAGGLPLEGQQALAQLVLGFLRSVGFREAVGFDNRGHTRLVGTVPEGVLDQLLEDLRWQGSGWLTPRVPVDALPQPIRTTWPVRVVEVLPEPDGVTAAVPPRLSAVQADLSKVAPDLRALTKTTGPTRLEILLTASPPDYDDSWRSALTAAAPGLQVEGRLGLLVTVRALPSQAAALAQLPLVSTIRLPRPAFVQPVTAAPDSVSIADALRASGLERLQQQGHRGQKVRVAVIDSDFGGYQQFVGTKIPARTRYVDLTAECDPNVEPQYTSRGPSPMGPGTQAALALALAAPEAELSLIRVDPEAPYQLLAVARYLNGEAVRSYSLDQRGQELAAEASRLETLRDKLLAERKTVLENFSQEEAAVKRREELFKREVNLERQEQELACRQTRYLTLIRDLRSLKGIQVVSCGLSWSDGHPVDGSSPLSRYMDETLSRAVLWFQATGNTSGQAWAGYFWDTDGNGVLEFAPPNVPLPPGRWTRELNFLSWQPRTGAATQDLPKCRLRVSVQWREPHDSAFWGERPDPFRVPLADLALVVLRQRDPTGTKLPADDLEVVARSTELPQRLENLPTSAVYEQAVEFAVDNPGRYALRVEGRVPRSIRPPAEPTLPSLQVTWELHPRLFLTVLDEASRGVGRVVLQDYPTNQGTLGMPADGHGVVSVGAADLNGTPRRYSAAGPAYGLSLHVKPDLLAFDGLALGLTNGQAAAGTEVAASFAAGTAACALSAGVKAEQIVELARKQPGRLLRLP
jgi:hypothetical protein